MKWTLILSPNAVKQYKKLNTTVRKRVRAALEKLSENPWGMPYKKLRGAPFYRARVGEFRIIYSVDEEELSVFVVRIDKRSRVYKRL